MIANTYASGECGENKGPDIPERAPGCLFPQELTMGRMSREVIGFARKNTVFSCKESDDGREVQLGQVGLATLLNRLAAIPAVGGNPVTKPTWLRSECSPQRHIAVHLSDMIL